MPSTSELLNEAEWRRCARDVVYFIETYWHIQTPDGARVMRLRDAQHEALKHFRDDDRVIVLKARQIGWTTLCAAFTFHQAFFTDDQQIIFLSKGEREAQNILRMVKYGFQRLPDWMRARGPKPTADNLSALPFDNASFIESLPSKKDPARGRTVNLVIVDEWAFLENPEDAWASIEPITDIGGRVIGLSTANGWGNFFHTMWVKAETRVSGFVPLFYSWRAVPERDDNWYAIKQRDMLPWQLHQEYPTTPEEAFIKSGNPVFDGEMLQAMSKRTVEPRRGYLFSLAPRAAEFRESRDGQLAVYEMPDPAQRYVIGADIAEGLEHGDFSSAHVISINTGHVVAHWHGKTDPDVFGEHVLAPLGWFYNRALIGPEANNHGLTTCIALKRLPYPNVYYSWTYDERSRRQGKKIGWHTTRVTKPLAIDELNMELRNGTLSVPDAATIAELRTYVRDEKGGMNGSPFDDRVMSLAIANQMRKHAFAFEPVEPDNDYWTLEWWLRQGKEPEKRQIGRNSVRAA